MRLLSFKPTKPFKNLNAPYRMVFINEDTLEEVASFHLTKKSVYGLFSTIFFLTILATVAVLLFTPLKYYIPGYGSNELRTKALALTHEVDSLNDLAAANTRRSQRIQRLIAGKEIVARDTAMLKPGLMRSAPEGVLPAPDEIRQQAGQSAAPGNYKHDRKRK
jgi:hypothetical protein